MGEEDDSSKIALGFRWVLVVTRYVLAVVVTVVAVVTVVMGLQLVLRPIAIELNISQSNVFVTRFELSDNNATYYFRFYLEATNPSEHVFIYYHNITVQLLNTTPSAPGHEPDLLASFDLVPSSLSLSQKEEQEFLAYGRSSHVTMVAVDKLFRVDGAEIKDAVMQLRGIMAVDNIKGGRTAIQLAEFHCQQVVVKNSNALPEPSSKNYNADCAPAYY